MSFMDNPLPPNAEIRVVFLKVIEENFTLISYYLHIYWILIQKKLCTNSCEYFLI